MSFCKECITISTHEGTPEGKLETIGGIECYVATPTVDYPKDKVVLYLSDVFGLSSVNTKLLADDFARNGFKTIAPDLVANDPVPLDALATGFDIHAWLNNGHSQAEIRPVIDKVIAALKASGVTTFAATGYCLGGRYVFDLGIDNVIKVGATSHPSSISSPVDFETYVAKSTVPLLINSCTFDELFPLEAQAKADEVLRVSSPDTSASISRGVPMGLLFVGI
ncbi:dienelactone hydrolase endo-1,3,1,4-beta-D-glucanase [Favolaschia claudopus]|uniref:Dienelactone hydrolase endo-1,3,1,4-beta-D-glucanase n=1 Tax=Favolaschia claudopus TaxID=2862362 RepID=A0AAW0DCC9_9AGAR